MAINHVSGSRLTCIHDAWLRIVLRVLSLDLLLSKQTGSSCPVQQNAPRTLPFTDFPF